MLFLSGNLCFLILISWQAKAVYQGFHGRCDVPPLAITPVVWNLFDRVLEVRNGLFEVQGLYLGEYTRRTAHFAIQRRWLPPGTRSNPLWILWKDICTAAATVNRLPSSAGA
jgi:hypothetical protein